MVHNVMDGWWIGRNTHAQCIYLEYIHTCVQTPTPTHVYTPTPTQSHAPLEKGKFTWITEEGREERWVVASCGKYTVLWNFRYDKGCGDDDEGVGDGGGGDGCVVV